MNTTTVRPEVAAFLAEVRGQLADLDPEQRDELLDGLEADLSEQVAAGDPLPDPVAYAAELRAAAGVAPGPRRGRWLSVAEVLDQCRAEWLGWTRRSSLTERAWAFAETLRPAWWVLRAWVAVTLVDQLTGDWEYVTLLPSLGVPGLGAVVLALAVVASVLIGQGTLWPGSGPDRAPAARAVLVALNVFAVLVPVTFTVDGYHRETYVSAVASPRFGPDVLHHGRDVVRNIYAYDQDGQPLQGVQLYDQKGRPVAVSAASSMGYGRAREVTCPWFNGATPLFNIFPLPQRTQSGGTCLGDSARAGEPAFKEPPLAAVPPVSPPVAAP